MNTAPNAERRLHALRLMREALEQDTARRDAWLTERCGDNRDLLADVQRLLDADRESNGPLDQPWQNQLDDPVNDSLDPRIGRPIGPYVLQQLLGHGGMGAVFRASRVHGGFEQQVAIKLIRGGFDDLAARQRFERERSILARLDHPDLAPLLDGGVGDDGAPWYAMPLIDGLPVTDWCDQQRMPLRDRIALAARLCDAVQAAHQALVVHRDLKPSNILVDARGAPHVLDFGIAKLLDEADEATHTAARLMTPAYAAPEQIRGEAISTATDVFALGVIIYELACGAHPFGGSKDSAFALQRAVIESEPRRLSAGLGDNTARAIECAHRRHTVPARLRRDLHGDLSRVVQKALAKSPQDRYGSAAALADDLRNWLVGQPVQAIPARLAYRARKFILRWRWPLTGALILLIALLAATGFSLRQARLAREAQRVAEANAHSAQAVQDFLQKVFLAAEPWRNEGTPPDALELANRAFESLDHELADQPRARADLYLALSRLYVTAGTPDRAVQAAAQAVRLYDQLPVSSQRRFDAHMNLGFAYGTVGELDHYESTLDAAMQLPGIGANERARGAMQRAEINRERGRFDQITALLDEALPALDEDHSLWREALYARADAARMLRQHRDAARDFVRFMEADDRRGLRAVLAMQALSELPPAQRRASDLQLAEQLEAERAVVWPDDTWQERFAGLRTALYLQHEDFAGALNAARSLHEGTGGDNYAAQFRLLSAYTRLAGGEHEAAAAMFDRVTDSLKTSSAASDPRLLLASAGARCARGEALPAALRNSLAEAPQPSYWGYAWLRIAPCADLRYSQAAQQPDPQAYAEDGGLRQALDAVAARLGECQDGQRVAIGAACPAH